MSFSYYRVLWIIIHSLADLVEAIYHFGLEFRENFSNFIKNMTKSIQTDQLTSDRQLIERHLNKITKLPKHLAVILNVNSGKDVDLKQLTNLVLWSLSSGVNFISFYDYKGKFYHNHLTGRVVTKVNISKHFSRVQSSFSLNDLSHMMTRKKNNNW